jgi:hypothetical protein
LSVIALRCLQVFSERDTRVTAPAPEAIATESRSPLARDEGAAQRRTPSRDSSGRFDLRTIAGKFLKAPSNGAGARRVSACWRSRTCARNASEVQAGTGFSRGFNHLRNARKEHIMFGQHGARHPYGTARCRSRHGRKL